MVHSFVLKLSARGDSTRDRRSSSLQNDNFGHNRKSLAHCPGSFAAKFGLKIDIASRSNANRELHWCFKCGTLQLREKTVGLRLIENRFALDLWLKTRVASRAVHCFQASQARNMLAAVA
jgi:hypothetical protein